MKYSEIERKLRKEGCYLIRDGDHPLWYSSKTGKVFRLVITNQKKQKLGR